MDTLIRTVPIRSRRTQASTRWNRTMTTIGRVSSIECQDQRRLLPVAAWSCAMAIVLALATVAAWSTDDVSVVSRISTSAVSPPTRENITLICQSTPYPSACETALSSAEARSSGDNPFAASTKFAMSRATTARELARNLSASTPTSPPSGMRDCAELLDLTVHHLSDALAGATSDADGARTWLSAAMTFQDTCNDSLASVPASLGRDAVRRQVAALSQFVGTALALHVGTMEAPAPSPRGVAFPSWLSEHDRRLMESPVADITADAVVALDGSGTHRSINDAIADVVAASSRGDGAGASRRVVLRLKAGRYVGETVRITNANVMLVGDGKGKTILEGHKSAGDGYTTYNSASLVVLGAGFIGKGLSIINSAGPRKGQAVAVLVSGDRSVLYQCEIKGYQDTLYTQANRQFYAQTTVSGTVDFIFGNSAVVFQNCDIQARKPSHGQVDTITAQGRNDGNQNTGITFQNCRITGAPDIGGTAVYLGRPWRDLARVGVMESDLDGSVAAAGWLEWSDPSSRSTVFYGEFANTGPGAATNGRVAWHGVHASMTTADATEFTVKKLIAGDTWLPDTGVPYASGLFE